MAKRKKRRTGPQAERQLPPPRHNERPTPERAAHGRFVEMLTEDAGVKHARDVEAHPIDALEWRGVLSSDQASAGRDFEELYLRANEMPPARDSTTIWEPKGHDGGDGPVQAVRDRRELYLFLGVVRDRQLRRVCVDHVSPKPSEVGILREALNECARFFKGA